MSDVVDDAGMIGTEQFQMQYRAVRRGAVVAASTVNVKPWFSSADSAALKAASRSAGISTRAIPAKFSARRAMRLSSQLPPASVTASDRVSTRPGRSVAMKVRTRDFMGNSNQGTSLLPWPGGRVNWPFAVPIPGVRPNGCANPVAEMAVRPRAPGTCPRRQAIFRFLCWLSHSWDR